MATNSIRSSQDGAGAAELESLQARKLNANYMARFVYQAKEAGESGESNVISLYMPENFQFNFSSAFDQPFSQGLVNMPGMNQLAKFAGASLTSQSMSVQVWQGTSCPEFNLTFQLIAENDPMQDIINPIRRLSKLCLPGQNAARLLTPPGPRIDLKNVVAAGSAAAKGAVSGIGAALTSGGDAGDYSGLTAGLQSIGTGVSDALGDILKSPENNVSLYIGRFLRFPSVVIQSVSQTYDTIFDRRGLPLKASIDVTLSTWYVPVKTDVDAMFVGGS